MRVDTAEGVLQPTREAHSRRPERGAGGRCRGGTRGEEEEGRREGGLGSREEGGRRREGGEREEVRHGVHPRMIYQVGML